MENNNIIFELAGCDISFIAQAPKDITLEQLLKQCDKIEPDWCDCGIKSSAESSEDVQLFINYDSIYKANEDVPC